MPINERSTARTRDLLMELEKNGITPVHRMKRIYEVNGKTISIRTTTKPGPKYWYDVSASVLDEVDHFLYNTDGPQHFALFPSEFFKKNYGALRDSNRPDAKIFYIDWPRKVLSSGSASIGISEFCCSLDPMEAFGNWPEVLQDRVGKLKEQIASDLASFDDEETREEGAKEKRLSNFYERDPILRQAAVQKHKTTCVACGFNFFNVYGEHGRDYIEVHHLIPISTFSKSSIVNPEKDMTVVCSNCHRMIHRKRERPLSISELIEIINKQKHAHQSDT